MRDENASALSFGTCAHRVAALNAAHILLREQLVGEIGAAVRLLSVVIEKELSVQKRSFTLCTNEAFGMKALIERRHNGARNRLVARTAILR